MVVEACALWAVPKHHYIISPNEANCLQSNISCFFFTMKRKFSNNNNLAWFNPAAAFSASLPIQSETNSLNSQNCWSCFQNMLQWVFFFYTFGLPNETSKLRTLLAKDNGGFAASIRVASVTLKFSSKGTLKSYYCFLFFEIKIVKVFISSIFSLFIWKNFKYSPFRLLLIWKNKNRT
jgi:hypothetical protein